MNENYETIVVNNEIDTVIDLDDCLEDKKQPCKDNPESHWEDNDKCHYDTDCCEGSFTDIFEKCEITKNITKQVYLECQGRLLRLKLNLKNLCAGNYINLGVVIMNMNQEIIGFRVKKFKVPGAPHTCTDIYKEFCFAFEDKHVCAKRRFKVLVIAQYC